MKPLATLMLCLLAFCFAACAKSPEARYYQTRASVTLAEDLMSDGYEAGKIPPREMVAGGEAIKAARRSLDVMKAQLPGGSPTFDQYFKSVNGAVLPLIQLYLPKGKATNGPGNARLDHHGGIEGGGVLGSADRAAQERGQDHARGSGDDRDGGSVGGRSIRPELGRRPGEACGGRELSLYIPAFTLQRIERRLTRAA